MISILKKQLANQLKLTLMLLVLVAMQVHGKNALAEYELLVAPENYEAIETEIYSAFEPIVEIELLICAADSVSADDIFSEYPDIKLDTKDKPLIWINFKTGNKLGILPAFYWGCFFGPVGILLTGILSKWELNPISHSVAGTVIFCNGAACIISAGYIVYLYYLLFKIFEAFIFI